MKSKYILTFIAWQLIAIMLLLMWAMSFEATGHTWNLVVGYVVFVALTVFNVIGVIGAQEAEAIKFYTDCGAKIPTKRDGDAGYDIYSHFDGDTICVMPHETLMVSTGLYSVFSSRYVAVLKERGSTGTLGIGQRSGIIDADYRGEWKVPITNHNDKILIISKKFKSTGEDEKYIYYPASKAICQALILPVPDVRIKEITHERFVKHQTERGSGMLGSSGK